MNNENLTITEVLEIGYPWYARVIVIQNTSDNTYQIKMSYSQSLGDSYIREKKYLPIFFDEVQVMKH